MSKKDNTEVAEDIVEQEDNLNEEIRASFDDCVASEKDEDATKLEMISAGATFKNVTRLYNQFMIDAGLAISKADRAQLVEDTLSGREFDTEESFADSIEALMGAVQGSTERSAAALIRSYAKKNELEAYAKPKGAGGTRVSFASKFYDFLIADPAVSVEGATAYINGEGDHEDTSENVKKHASHYLAIHAMANAIAANK